MLMMLPFEAPTIFEGIHKSYFRMPRVVKDQRSRFENDDLFRQLSHESAVKYTGFKDRPLAERQQQFITDCYLGHTEVSVVQSGNQFTLMFTPTANPAYEHEGCYIDKEQNKAHIKAGFILNGVCVLWRGWIDLQRLEGFGCLEYDEYRAYLEDAMAKQQADGKQQPPQPPPMCNNSLAGPPQAPPLGRLNHHLTGAASAPSLNHAAAAAAAIAATTNSMLPPPPVGLNSSCLTAAAATGSTQPAPLAGLVQAQQQQQQQVPPPPGSLADSAAAAHYGNAAIAAAAAAAFHQALSAGGPQSLNGLHGLGVPQPQAPHSLVSSHLAYTTTSHSNVNTSSNTNANSSPTHRTSPQHLFMTNHQQVANNRHSKSPERENHQGGGGGQNGAAATKRHSSKRHHEEMGQSDEVDVVSDISVHELDFPPRRIFKSEQQSLASHHHLHSQQKISRRAA